MPRPSGFCRAKILPVWMAVRGLRKALSAAVQELAIDPLVQKMRRCSLVAPALQLQAGLKEG